jgi:hypothetical protein
MFTNRYGVNIPNISNIGLLSCKLSECLMRRPDKIFEPKQNIGKGFTITNPIFKVFKSKIAKRSFKVDSSDSFAKFIPKVFKIAKSYKRDQIPLNSKSLNYISQKLNDENTRIISNFTYYQRPYVGYRNVFSIKKIKNGINATLEELEGSSTCYGSVVLPMRSRIDAPIFRIQRIKKNFKEYHGKRTFGHSKSHGRVFKIFRKLTKMCESTGSDNSSIGNQVKFMKYFKIHRNAKKRFKKIVNPIIDGRHSAFSKYKQDMNIGIDEFFRKMTSEVLVNSSRNSHATE